MSWEDVLKVIQIPKVNLDETNIPEYEEEDGPCKRRLKTFMDKLAKKLTVPLELYRVENSKYHRIEPTHFGGVATSDSLKYVWKGQFDEWRERKMEVYNASPIVFQSFEYDKYIYFNTEFMRWNEFPEELACKILEIMDNAKNGFGANYSNEWQLEINDKIYRITLSYVENEIGAYEEKQRCGLFVSRNTKSIRGGFGKINERVFGIHCKLHEKETHQHLSRPYLNEALEEDKMPMVSNSISEKVTYQQTEPTNFCQLLKNM